MKQHDQFMAAVQAELDAGRDPLDYAEIVAWLEEHPEALEDFVNLRAVGLELAALPFQDQEEAPGKPTAWWKKSSIVLTAAGLLVSLSLRTIEYFDSKTIVLEEREAHAKIEADAHDLAESQTYLTTSAPAVLLSVDVRSQRSFTVSDFAPADPETGAVVLSMTSNIQHTQL